MPVFALCSPLFVAKQAFANFRTTFRVPVRNLQDAVAAGLTSIPKKRKPRSRSSGDAAGRGGGGTGRFRPQYSSSEPEFGWQSNKMPTSASGYGAEGMPRGESTGFDNGGGGSGDGGGDMELEGFEG